MMEKTEILDLNDRNLILKRYHVRATGKNGRTIETSVPREVFEREVRRQGLTMPEALEKLEAVWRYNSFRGLHLSFEPKNQDLLREVP
jgi:hypothetical protein